MRDAPVIVLFVALVAAALAAEAWLVMVLVGVWHSIRPAVPAIGFWETALVLLIVMVTGGTAFVSARRGGD